jgi:hypothetical protein
MNDKIVPQAGDIVICTSGVNIGHIACLGGVVGHVKDSFHMTFNFNAFNDGDVVSCSGGSSFDVNIEDLIPTGREYFARFWKWKDGIAGKGNGEDYQKNVALWEYKSVKPHALYPGMSVKDVLYRKSLNFDADIVTPEKGSGCSFAPMRGDYTFTNMLFPEEIGVRRYYDSAGASLFEAAKYFKSIYLHQSKYAVGCGYHYIITIDSSSFTAFRTEDELISFINAYKLIKVKGIRDGQFNLIPNLEVNTWSQVHWRKIVKNAA